MALVILSAALVVGAAVLFRVFDAATAAFLLLAAVVISVCAASTALLGAYTRNKAIARQREEEKAETIDDRSPPQE